eukprot:scaffold4328_cov201-Pinguiococcus_pyrenoidosus.AAC.1
MKRTRFWAFRTDISDADLSDEPSDGASGRRESPLELPTRVLRRRRRSAGARSRGGRVRVRSALGAGRIAAVRDEPEELPLDRLRVRAVVVVDVELQIQDHVQPRHQVLSRAGEDRRCRVVRHPRDRSLDRHVLAHQGGQHDADDGDPKGQQQQNRRNLTDQKAHDPSEGEFLTGRHPEADEIRAAGDDVQVQHAEGQAALVQRDDLLVPEKMRVPPEYPLLQVWQGIADGDLHHLKLPVPNPLDVVDLVDVPGLQFDVQDPLLRFENGLQPRRLHRGRADAGAEGPAQRRLAQHPEDALPPTPAAVLSVAPPAAEARAAR